MRSSHFKWPLLEVQGTYSIEVESVSKKNCTHKKKASIREKNLKDVSFFRIFSLQAHIRYTLFFYNTDSNSISKSNAGK